MRFELVTNFNHNNMYHIQFSQHQIFSLNTLVTTGLIFLFQMFLK